MVTSSFPISSSWTSNFPNNAEVTVVVALLVWLEVWLDVMVDVTEEVPLFDCVDVTVVDGEVISQLKNVPLT